MTPRRRSKARVVVEPVEVLACGLGVFSLLLGLAELVAPRPVGNTVGMEHRPRLLRAYGLREVLAGIGILAGRRPSVWMWSRVAGDLLDLATLASGLGSREARRGNIGKAMAAVAAVTLIDIYCAWRLGAEVAPRAVLRDYGGRRGFPDTPERMRGAALH
jgi:hypothetical protein